MEPGLYRNKELILNWDDLHIDDVFDEYSSKYNDLETILENCGAISTDTLVLTKNIESIPSNTFMDIALDTVIVQNGTKKIRSDAFSDSKIKHIILPISLEIIGYASFADCKALEEIIIPEKIKAIPKSCFANCLNLKEIELPKNLEIIDFGALSNCYSLEKINIPKNVFRIGANAFKGCEKLEKIILPESLERLEIFAFNGCNINTFTIPKNIMFLDDFVNDKNIDVVMYKKTIENLKCIATDNFLESKNKNIINKEITLDELLDEGKSFREIATIYKDIEELI